MLAFRFAQAILRSRFQAIFFALLFAALPFFTWISGVVVGLVTLRKGKMEGFLVMLWSLLPGLGYAAYSHDWNTFIFGAVFGSFLLWILAVILRYRSRWDWVLYAAAVFGLIGVGVFHLIVLDTPAWWLKELTNSWQTVQQSINVNGEIKPQAMQTGLALLSQYATGLKIVLFSFFALVELFFARSMEYLLIKPGGMAREFGSIRLNLFASILLVVCLIVAKAGPQIFKDCLPVLALPFAVAGVSVVHRFLMCLAKAQVWLLIFYLVLIFIVMFFPPIMLLFVGIAVLDSAINFRRFCRREKNASSVTRTSA